ncbi:MAG TPA: hypothetical protein VF921_08110 [Vicinamibacterales bacterium]
MLPALRSAILGALLISLASAPGAAPQKQAPRVNPNAAVIRDFLTRVDKYVTLHKKLEDTIPKLSKQATPQEIDTHERALAKLIQEGRKDAKPGDLLTPGMQRFIRSLLRPVFSGKAGLQIKDEIVDKEYKGNVKLVVNGRYPDEVPISTMPPQVLAALPKLPEELEYRFIRRNMILFDPHAHIIVDFMERAFS